MLEVVVNGDDVGVAEFRRGARFFLEAFDELSVFGDGWRKNLERDDAVERNLASAVDCAHAALPYFFNQFERSHHALCRRGS